MVSAVWTHTYEWTTLIPLMFRFWATLPKWVPPHIQNWPSPIFMKMHRRIHRCIKNRYSKYRHSMNNRFGENELWKVSRASLWYLLGVIEDIDDLILTAFVVKRPSFKNVLINKRNYYLHLLPRCLYLNRSARLYVSNYRNVSGVTQDILWYYRIHKCRLFIYGKT